jgi:hypothetical protein
MARIGGHWTLWPLPAWSHDCNWWTAVTKTTMTDEPRLAVLT